MTADEPREHRIAALVASEATDSLDVISSLAHALDDAAVGIIDTLARQAVIARDRDRADAILLRTERAAQLAGADTIRAWARLVRGLIAVGRQDHPRAQALIPESMARLDAADTPLPPQMVPAYIEGGDWIWQSHMAQQRLPEAREQLGRMLRHARTGGLTDNEARVVLKLLWMSLSTNDLRATEAYALALVGGLWTPLLHAEDVRATMLDLLSAVTSALSAGGTSHYSAVRHIGHAIVIEGVSSGEVVLDVALAAFAQDDFAEALPWFDRLLEAPEQLVPDYDVTLLYQRRAYCLLNLKRPQESLEAIERAIARAPDDPYMRFAAAQVFAALGDDRRTIEEYSSAANLATARLQPADTNAAQQPTPGSNKEYASRVPLTDLREFALMRRAQGLHARGDRAAAVATFEQLLTVADVISKTSALLTLAKWAEEEHRREEAIALLERARALNYAQRAAEIAFRLATLSIESEAYERAIDVLAPLCHRSGAPNQCIELLDRIPRTWAGYPRVLKQRGYARTQTGSPAEGYAELSEAAAADPSDAEAFMHRALARLTLGSGQDQQAWNSARSMQHILESLDDLYAARRLRPDDAEILLVIKWLVERAAAQSEMLEIFSRGGSPDGDLFAAFPHFESTLDLSWQANELARRQRWTDAAALWLQAQAAQVPPVSTSCRRD